MRKLSLSMPCVVSVFALAGVSAVGSQAQADSVTLTTVADNTLYETPTGSTSNGSGTAMFAGRNSGATNSRRRALVRFDFSTIPAGSTITGVSLSLSNSATNSDPATVSLFTVAQSWGEGASVATGGQGSGTAAAAGDATWLHRSFNSSLWTNPGGDFALAPSASTSVIGPGTYQWSSAGLIANVQAFLANPAGNFGWILIGDESVASSAKKFSTREDPAAALRPALSVTFVVPAPAATGVLGLGLLTLSRRRRC